LEAAAAGCSLILPDSAPVKEYFSGYPVKYINPEKIDPHLIRDTVNQPPPPDLAEHIIRAFSERILPEYMDRIIIKPFLSN